MQAITLSDSTRFCAFPARLINDFDALVATATAILRHHPGIERDRFLLKLGFELIRSGKSRPRPSAQGERALKQLEAANIIRLQPPTAIREQTLVYPAGYRVAVKPRDRAVDLLAVRSWIEPSLVGTWQPAAAGKRNFRRAK
jgi:hypothetical protein